MQAIGGGEVFSQNLDGWKIAWESKQNYRFWCIQQHDTNTHHVAVVMLNPGSLSRNGENLTRDTTLRILREVFLNTGFNPFVINLFNLATPSPEKLFEHWDSRDDEAFSYSALPINSFKAVLFAYGDYEYGDRYGPEIKERISLLRGQLSAIQEIVIPKNKSGTPKHPLVWQRQKLKDVVREAIVEAFQTNGW